MGRGSLLVAGSKTGTLNVWDAQSGRLLIEEKAHFDAIENISVAAEDSLILTSSAGGDAKLWVYADLL